MSTIYSPLCATQKEIRLLCLERGSGLDELRGTLQTISLVDDGRPQYETISYCWGDATQRGDITINKQVNDYPASACAALRCLRLADQDRVLWIDSICIDQDNLSERNQQVSIMTDVYTNAHCNLVYLGDSDEYPARAFASVTALVREAVQEGFTAKDLEELTSRPSETGFSVAIDEEALLNIFESPWFRRLWIVQEVVLSCRNVAHYGSFTIDLLEILRAATWIIYKARFLRTRLNKTPGLLCASYIRAMVDPQSSLGVTKFPCLASFWVFCRSQKATDIRDKVYGILGMYLRISGRQGMHSLIKPDYKRAPSDVIRNATRYALFENRSILSLQHGNRRDLEYSSTVANLPSWMPSWFQALDFVKDATPLSMSFVACGNLEFLSTEDLTISDFDCLTLPGYRVDTVMHISAEVTQLVLQSHNEMLNMLEQVLQLSTQAVEETANASADTKLGMTLIAMVNWRNKRASREDAEGLYHLLKWLKERKCLPPMVPAFTASTSPQARAAGRYWDALSIIRNRRFFITSIGHIGIGPLALRPGDKVTVLRSGHVPYVLRQCQSGFEVVGPCYVHGIMDGEFVKQKQAAGEKLELFDLW